AHARIVVHVDDEGGGIGGLGELVGVRGGGQARAEVEELADALPDHVPDRAAEDLPVQPGAAALVAHGLHGLGGDRAVDREVVLAAQDGVIYPGHAGLGGV